MTSAIGGTDMYEFGRTPSEKPRYISPIRGLTGWQRIHTIIFQQKRLYYEVPTPNLWRAAIYQQFANGNAMFAGKIGDVDGTLWSVVNPNGQGTFSDIAGIPPGGTIFTGPWFGWHYAGVWDSQNNGTLRNKVGYGALTLLSWWPKGWTSFHGQI